MVRGGLRRAESADRICALLDFRDSFVPLSAIYKESWNAGFNPWHHPLGWFACTLKAQCVTKQMAIFTLNVIFTFIFSP